MQASVSMRAGSSSFCGGRRLQAAAAAPRAAVLGGRPSGLTIVAAESRIGKRPVQIPSSVKVKLEGQYLHVKGPKGELERTFPAEIDIQMNDNELVLKKVKDDLRSRRLHGRERSYANNMVTGVSEGFSKTLLLIGVGYRAALEKKELVMNLGFSHPVNMPIPDGVDVKVEDKGLKLIVSGHDKMAVGSFCSKIRMKRPPEPYKGKGVRYADEYVRRKEGKSGK